MDPLTWGIAGGAGLGLIKSLFDSGNEARQRRIQGETTRYSPWTGMQAQAPKPTDYVGNLLSSGLAGAQVGQSISSPTKLFSQPIADSQAAVDSFGIPGMQKPAVSLNPWEKLLHSNTLSGGEMPRKYSIWGN